MEGTIQNSKNLLREGNNTIAKLFTALICADSQLRIAAENKFRELKNGDLALLLRTILEYLNTADVPPEHAHLGLVVIKNELFGKDKEQSWLNLPVELRRNMKASFLRMMVCRHYQIRAAATMIISKIAIVDIPLGEWKDLIRILLEYAQQSPDEGFRKCAFNCLEYICEEIPDDLQGYLGEILTAFFDGMKSDQKDVQIAALSAFGNSLAFSQSTFDNDEQCETMFKGVLKAASSDVKELRIKAFNCLVNLGAEHYGKLEPYMQEIFKMSVQVVTAEGDQEDDVLQVIEFWSIIAEKEFDINEGGDHQNQNYTKTVIPYLVPLLLKLLTTQNSLEDGDDDWTPAQASGSCLGLLTQVAGDAILPLILPFVQENIKSEDWHCREAAVLAFGSVMDGTSKDKMGGLCLQVLPVILEHGIDKDITVRDTSIWTLGNMCRRVPEVLISRVDIFVSLLEVLLEALKAPPKTAANACWAIHNIAEKVDYNEIPQAGGRLFNGLIQALVKVLDRDDASENSLMASAFEAIVVLIEKSTPQDEQAIEELARLLGDRLHRLSTADDLSGSLLKHKYEVQNGIISTLGAIINKFDVEKIIPQADMFMTLFLEAIAGKDKHRVMEETFIAVGALVACIGSRFDKYTATFLSEVLINLKAYDDPAIWTMAVSVIGDICRSVENKITPYCDKILECLVLHLQNPKMNMAVKPHIICCMGDIALAIGGTFEKYVRHVMKCIIEASGMKNAEDVDFLNDLREAIFEACTGILQGLSAGDKADCWIQYVPSILELIALCINDEKSNDQVLNSACGIVGDIASCLGPPARVYLVSPVVQKLLKLGSESETMRTKSTARYATEVVQKLSQS